MSAFSDSARADELEKYVHEKLGPQGATKAKEAADSMRLRAALKTRELPIIDRWIAGQSGG